MNYEQNAFEFIEISSNILLIQAFFIPMKCITNSYWECLQHVEGITNVSLIVTYIQATEMKYNFSKK